MNRALLASVLGLCFFECGCADRSSGTSTETENAFSAREFRTDSVLPSTGIIPGSPVVATLRLDRSNFDFSGSRTDGQDLDVSWLDGHPLAFEIAQWDPASARGRLNVRLEPIWSAASARLLVRSRLPSAVRSRPEEVWAGIGPSQRSSWTSVLVDDFEGGNLQHNRLPNASFWYNGGVPVLSGLQSGGTDRTGSVLRMACPLANCGERTLLAATLLSSSPRCFRSLDSIELWARGTGRIWIALESLDSVQLGRVSRGHLDSIQIRRASTSRVLDSTWHRLVVSPAEFLAAGTLPGEVGWTTIQDSVNYLTILFDGGSDLWIDDLRFHGIHADDLR